MPVKLFLTVLSRVPDRSINESSSEIARWACAFATQRALVAPDQVDGHPSLRLAGSVNDSHRFIDKTTHPFAFESCYRMASLYEQFYSVIVGDAIGQLNGYLALLVTLSLPRSLHVQ